ncbi:transglutaminase-like cysteine peptidase [Mariprofundus micogutta]|uniref:transglutaminase-like cysteine peptidase n=1 Tax=Mariprofundus micogutta TaxID=1921010 RepID=UPI001D0F9F2C|nr:transglutaminase-like cysteine peptidase [Mariprofundus micogutta]
MLELQRVRNGSRPSKEPTLSTRILKQLLFVWLVLAVSITTAGNGGFSPEFLDKIAKQFGNQAKERIIDWQKLIEDSKGDSEWQTIHAVNEFFNRVRFISDDRHWGRADYWATPVELLSTNGGDCEDFSIAKYFTLMELGIPDERLRITYVKALRLNQAHMVLAYYEKPDSEPLILDNLISRIKPASRRNDLLPVYSFNGNNLWMSKERGQGRKIAGGSQRINLWRDLNIRMKQERELGNSYTAKSMTR